ncbi:MAG: PilZ domain-containing protein [Nitrospirae bacterium]|nr:PilZ domain-containing protein [Nitrospirota bacterium]
MTKLNCWEIKKCGRETDGARINELGVCPVAKEERLDGMHDGKYAGRACWPVAGTFCGGVVQGTFAAKVKNCLECECYRQVVSEEGLNFQTSKEIMDSLHNRVFHVGLPILIKTGRQEESLSYLTGWKVNEYLITQLPYINGLPFGKGRYGLKYIKDGDAYIFDSDLVAVQSFPLPLAFFRYPLSVDKISLRKHRRYVTRLESTLTAADGEDCSINALTVDLGEGGCRLKVSDRAAHQIRPDRVFKLSFSFLDKCFKDIDCTVKKTGITEKFCFSGLEFQDLSADCKHSLLSVIEIMERLQMPEAPFS